MEREDEWRKLDLTSESDLALYKEAAKIVSIVAKTLEQGEWKYGRVSDEVVIYFDYEGPVVTWTGPDRIRAKGIDFGKLEILPERVKA